MTRRLRDVTRRCFNCGEELGAYANYDRLDTCGKRECDREARAIREEERQNAHDQLDRDMGWS
jgi:hypothetical protein